jgi:hypothetical protein
VNKKTDSKKTKKTPKTYPVPSWMESDLQVQAQYLDILERQTLAEKLERQAEQLREIKPPPVKFEARVDVSLRPNMKRALLAFAMRHGAKEEYTEQTKLQLGIRWFLEGALPLINLVSSNTEKQIHYREAEDMEDSNFTEKLIEDALADYLKSSESEDQ